jgi:hypothetical protein
MVDLCLLVVMSTCYDVRFVGGTKFCRRIARLACDPFHLGYASHHSISPGVTSSTCLALGPSYDVTVQCEECTGLISKIGY